MDKLCYVEIVPDASDWNGADILRDLKVEIPARQKKKIEKNKADSKDKIPYETNVHTSIKNYEGQIEGK